MALQPIDCDEVITPTANVLSHRMHLLTLHPMDYARFQCDKALQCKRNNSIFGYVCVRMRCLLVKRFFLS